MDYIYDRYLERKDIVKKQSVKKIRNRIAVFLFSLLLLCNIALAGYIALGQTAQASTENPVVQISGTKNYAYAFEVLELVNAERSAEGLSPLTLDVNMTEQAMKRAAQITIYFEHSFPYTSEKSLLQTLRSEYPTAYGSYAGENIALGQSNPTAVMNSWMNSEGHKDNILYSKYTTIGIGYFEGGWVQLFGSGTGTEFSQPSNRSTTYDIEIDEDICPINLVLSSSASATVEMGNSITRTVRIRNSSLASRQVTILNAEWESSNNSVATVSNGKVTAVGTGTATITVSVGSASLSFDVTVPVRPTAVNISKTAITVNAGKVEQLTASVVPEGTGIGITWESSDATIASVSSEGYVTANSPGVCTITASAGTYASAACTVTVKLPATAVKAGEDLTIEKGKTHRLSAVVTPSNSTDSITWKSSNTAVVTVDKDGLLTAVGAGSAEVSAVADSGAVGKINVTVTSPCTDIDIAQDSIVLKLHGEPVTVPVQIAPTDCTDSVSWSIDNDIATIVPGATACTITPKSEGRATLTVTSGSHSDSVAVIVYDGITGLELPVTARVINGGSIRLKPEITPNGADSTLEWTSSDKNIAEVDESGAVTAHAVGNAIITVSADGVSAQCTVTVYEPETVATGIAFSEAEVTVKKGDTYVSKYAFTPVGGEAVVTWNSSNEDVATVDIDGTVTALADGEAVITATINGASDSYTVRVYTPVVYAESIGFLSTNLTVKLNNTVNLAVIPGYSVSPVDWSESLTWSSSDSSIVSVENGTVTAKACGTANITVSGRDCSATISINVVSPCTGVSLPEERTVLKGESVALNVVVTPDVCTDEIIWSSSDGTGLKLTAASGTDAVFAADKRGVYTVTVKCGDFTAQCTITVEANPELDPGTPTVTVKPLGYTSLEIKWTNEDNCDGYQVERATSANGPWTRIADVKNTNATVYRHSGLTFNRTYYFRARGYKLDSTGEYVYGEWSGAATGKPQPVISGLKASVSSISSVKLTWTKNTTAKGYYIYRSADNGASWKLLKTITKNSTVSYSGTGLECGREYLYKVVPFRTSGKKRIAGAGSIVSVTTTPAKPTSLSASVTSSRPKLAWKKVTGAHGYEIWRSDSYDGEYVRIATVTSGNTLTWTDTATAENRYYKIRAYRGTSYGTVYSDYTSAVTATAKLGKPTVFATSASYSSVKLSWHKVTGATGYKIYRSTDGESFALVKTITGSTTLSWTNTGLANGREYYYYVVPYTSSMTGTGSDIVCAVPTIGKPSPTVSAYSYYLKLTWKKVSGATGYNIYRSTDDESYELCAQISSGSTVAWSDTQVVRGVKYSYKIAAVRSGTQGPLSAAKTGTPTLSAPSGVKAARTSATGIKVTWKKVSGAQSYEIMRSSASNGTYETVAIVNGNSSVAYTDSKLEAGKTYYYIVRSVREIDGYTAYSGNSSTVSAKTTLYAPSNVKVVSTGYRSIAITWSAASGADGYVIYRATSKNGTYSKLAEVGSDVLGYDDVNLTANKYYYYKIKTVHNNTSGTVYSGYSTYKYAKTALKAPTGVDIDYSPEYVGIYWIAGDEATGYQVYRSAKKSSGYTRQGSYSENSFEDYEPGDNIYLGTPYRYGDVRFVYFSNVSASKTYYYKIRAVKSTDSATYYSAYTACKTVKTVVQTPVIQEIMTLNDGTSVIAFYDATGAEDYAVYRATSKKGTYSNITGQCEWYYDEDSGLNLFVVPTPTDGKRYYFKMRGIYYGSKVYYSSYSAIKSVVA